MDSPFVALTRHAQHVQGGHITALLPQRLRSGKAVAERLVQCFSPGLRTVKATCLPSRDQDTRLIQKP
jgi:hypothetical protein